MAALHPKAALAGLGMGVCGFNLGPPGLGMPSGLYMAQLAQLNGMNMGMNPFNMSVMGISPLAQLLAVQIAAAGVGFGQPGLAGLNSGLSTFGGLQSGITDSVDQVGFWIAPIPPPLPLPIYELLPVPPHPPPPLQQHTVSLALPHLNLLNEDATVEDLLPLRPPNLELLQLHAWVHEKLQMELASVSQAMTLYGEHLCAQQVDLLTGVPEIQDEMGWLKAVRDVCRGVVRPWRWLNVGLPN
ncbi:hypothetical protein V8E53_011575 [Lactarius tabidus]